MKVIVSFICFTLFCALSSFSQTGTTLSLSGKLIDKESREPILSASVSLLSAKDSAYMDGTFSNEKGEFSFRNLKANRYILKVTYIGYLTLFKNVNMNETSPVASLGELPMTANDIILKEAVVEGKRPEIAVKNDTVEYDATSYKTTNDAVVEDLLKKLPGVEVDKDGNVTSQGKSVTKMFVNGKEFFRDDPQAATKNMPADMIEKVQVYDRKSDMAQMTGFDMGDEETVMNLTVRPGMMQGTIGTVQVGAGKDVQTDNAARYNENAFVRHQRGSDSYTLIARLNNTNNMGGADITGGGGGGGGRVTGSNFGYNMPGIVQSQNYMLNINKEIKPNVFTINGDIRFNLQDRKVNSNSDQRNFLQNMTQQEIIKQYKHNSGNNFNTNLRIDWNPNKQHAMIIRPNIRFNQNNSDGWMKDKRTNMEDDSVLLDSRSLTSSKGNTFSVGGSLDYSFKFPKAGRVFSISMNGNYSNNYSQPKNKTYYPDPNIPNDSVYSFLWKNQFAENKNLTNNFSATFSYVEPLGHNNFLQILYRYAYSETESKNSTYNLLPDLLYSLDPFSIDTALIVPNQSRTTLRNATDQRIGLNFKIDRKKFNLTFGFNADPSKATNITYQPQLNIPPPQLIPSDFNGKLPLITGDTAISIIPINVVNYSPTVNFRYMIDQRSNLRVIYEGTTNQPSANQLRDYPYVDINSPNDVTQGNPQLKPSYTNNLRVEFNKYISATQMMYGFRANGNYIINDIIATTMRQESGKGNITSYQNVNGNWNVFLMGMINRPFGKKFSVGNMLMSNLSNSNSFIGSQTQQQQNTMRNRTIGDNLNLRLQLNDSLYFGTTGSINYSNISYTAVSRNNNQNIYNYSWGANIIWSFLPGWTFDSDINRTWRRGYPTGYNTTQTLWNAAITKQVFKKQFGTGSLKLQIFDILQDRKNITASQSASSQQFSQTNVIPSYFLASFIFRFSVFPKSSLLKASDMEPQRRYDGHGGGGRRQF